MPNRGVKPRNVPRRRLTAMLSLRSRDSYGGVFVHGHTHNNCVTLYALLVFAPYFVRTSILPELFKNINRVAV